MSWQGYLIALCLFGGCATVMWLEANQPEPPTPEQRCRDACGNNMECFGSCLGSAIASARNKEKRDDADATDFAIGMLMGQAIGQSFK